MLTWAMIIPLNYIENYPLKKEYWKKVSFEYKELIRSLQFLPTYSDNKSYKLLITPVDAKEGKFVAAMPFKNETPEKDVELFMLTSDWYVDPEADACAFYSMEAVIGIDIFTGETYHSNFVKNRKRKVN